MSSLGLVQALLQLRELLYYYFKGAFTNIYSFNSKQRKALFNININDEQSRAFCYLGLKAH